MTPEANTPACPAQPAFPGPRRREGQEAEAQGGVGQDEGGCDPKPLSNPQLLLSLSESYTLRGLPCGSLPLYPNHIPPLPPALSDELRDSRED